MPDYYSNTTPILGGFVQGLASGKEQTTRQALAQQELDIRKAALKAETKYRESMLEMEARGYTQKEEAAKAEADRAKSFMDYVAAALGPQGGLPGGAPPQAPPLQGSQMFPLDPSFMQSMNQWVPPSQEAAALTSPRAKPQLTFDSAGKTSVRMDEYRPRIDWQEMPGPSGNPIKVQFADGKPVPGTAIDVPVKLEQRKQTLLDGTELSFEVNPYTGQPAGDVNAAIPKGPSFRVTASAPTEEFKFTDTDGIEKSVIRKKQTGEWVTKPVPVAPAKGALASDAGKIEGAQKGIQNVNKLRGMLVDPKTGAVNRGLILKMWAPMGGFGEGRQIKSLFREALDVKIRAMTGAAISKEELPFYESTYLPHPLDDDALVIDKLTRLGDFLAGYQASVDPSGIATGRVEKATGGKKAPATGQKNKPSPKETKRLKYNPVTGELE